MRQGQKICLCYWQLTCGMPCICTMCRKLTDLPLCTILYCREQMSFVTKNVGRLWQFLRNAWLLPKIFWRKLLITLKKVVTHFLLSCYVLLLVLLNHVKRKKKNLFWIFFGKFQNFLLAGATELYGETTGFLVPCQMELIIKQFSPKDDPIRKT